MPNKFKFDHLGLNEFAHNNQLAMLLMHKGTSDYVGCRCCLLNGLFAGFQLGALAVEKFLKAMLTFSDPSISTRNFRHNLKTIAAHVEQNKIADLSMHQSTIDKLIRHYNSRYPDNKDQSISASTDELKSIDQLVLEIIDKMPVNEEVLLRSGVYTRVISDYEKNITSPERYWLTLKNPSLTKKLPALIIRNNEWLKFAFESSKK